MQPSGNVGQTPVSGQDGQYGIRDSGISGSHSPTKGKYGGVKKVNDQRGLAHNASKENLVTLHDHDGYEAPKRKPPIQKTKKNIDLYNPGLADAQSLLPQISS